LHAAIDSSSIHIAKSEGQQDTPFKPHFDADMGAVQQPKGLLELPDDLQEIKDDIHELRVFSTALTTIPSWFGGLSNLEVFVLNGNSST